MGSTAFGSRNQSSRWERLALLSGVLFAAVQLAVIVFALGVVVPTHAPVGAPPTETAAALARHASLVAVGTYLYTLPMPFLLLFLGGLFSALRRVEGGGGAFSAAALAAGIAGSIITPFGALLSGLSARVAVLGGDPAVVTELDSITPLATALAAFPHAVLLGTTSALLLASRLASRRVARFGLVLMLLALASTLTMVVDQLFPLVALEMLLFPIWVLALSVSLLRGGTWLA